MTRPARSDRFSLLLLWTGLLLVGGLIGCTENGGGSSTTTTAGLETEHPPWDAQATAQTVFVSAAAEEDTVADTAVDALDWTYWRGPEYSGTSRETGLVDDFDPRGGEGSNVLWKREDLGNRSTPIVMNGKLYLLARAEPETAREGERVVCLDAATGETRWQNRFNVWLSDVPDTRVAWSSVVGDPETGNVYALGVCGLFQCLDGESGETKWSHPLHEKFGLLSTYGGRTNFPVICDDLVIISAIIIGWGEMAKPAHRFLAFDKRTGEVMWFQGTRPLPYDTTYSAPALTVLKGQKAMVFGSGDGSVWAFQPRTGKPIWNFEFSRRGLNEAPLVVGDTVYMGHSEENIGTTAMGSLVALDGTGQGDVTKTAERWKVDELMVGKSAPVLVDGRLYCVDDRAKMYVVDANTGETLVRKALGTAMRSSLLYADGKIYATTANGRWYILEPDEERGVNILAKGRFPSGEECHASPICSHGRVYLVTTGGLYCLHDAGKTPGSRPRPPAPQESPRDEDPEPATLQIVPAEALLQPGQTQQYRARLFNSRGQLLRETAAQFSLEGPGEINEAGVFAVPSEAAHTATTVKAKVGELEGTARIRTIPPLPWTFDFEGLSDAPVTFVGARYRHVIRNVDGSNVMVKVTTIPKGTRSRSWFGHPELHDYTVEAEVKGALTENQMPDIGLIAQGYTLDLQGNGQRLQIRTWGSNDYRTAKAIDFPWEPNRWYGMKFRAENQEGKAVLRGKVWPREEDEPETWSIEVEDPAPNTHGSPGLYGSAKAAELYLDNIRVYENKP